VNVDGAVIREQGGHLRRDGRQAVRRDRPVTARLPCAEASRTFSGIPTVLMAQDASGRARYYGRRDIVDFMAKVPLSAVPWKRYRLAA
jgi:hypothetical protein